MKSGTLMWITLLSFSAAGCGGAAGPGTSGSSSDETTSSVGAGEGEGATCGLKGASCDSQSCCSGVCNEGVCACTDAHQNCTSNGQCCSGVCSAGTCAQCNDVGALCTIDANCCSGVCTDGICGHPHVDCSSHRCSADPAPTADSIAYCKQALADPKCSGAYADATFCYEQHQTCTVAGTTDENSFNGGVCQTEFTALANCVSAENSRSLTVQWTLPQTVSCNGMGYVDVEVSGPSSFGADADCTDGTVGIHFDSLSNGTWSVSASAYDYDTQSSYEETKQVEINSDSTTVLLELQAASP